MDKAFEALKGEGKNTVDSLVQWLKEANIIDGIKVTEEKAREWFQGSSDAANVEVDKFKEVLEKMAAEHSSTVEELFKDGLNLEGIMKAGMNAFRNA